MTRRGAATYDAAMRALAQDGVVTLRGRTRRLWALWAVCLVFGVTCLALVIGPLTSLPFGDGPRDTPLGVAIGALGFLLFGGLGWWLLPLHALRQREAVVIGRDGVRVSGSPPIGWSSIEEVHAGGAHGLGVTLLLDRPAPRAGADNRLAHALYAARTGRGAVQLPPVRGLSRDEVVALLAAGAARAT